MSNSTAEGSGTEAGASALQTDGPSRSHWEERLAAARAVREKVLEAKGKPVRKPTIGRPQFLDEDPAARLGPLAAWTEQKTTAEPPKTRPDAGLTGVAIQNLRMPDGALGRSDATTVPVVGEGAVSMSSIVTIAFACFFGLGFGMVLSFGALVAMGWISINGNGREDVASGPKMSVGAPDVSTIALSGLAPMENADSTVVFDRSSEDAVIAGMRDTPVLQAAFSADLGIETINSPAPRFDTAGIDHAPLSRFAFQPVDIYVSFESPVQPAVLPKLQGILDKTEDTLPIVPQKSSVTVASFVPNLNPPLIEKSRQVSEWANDVTPARMTIPALFTGSPGIVPKDVQRQPDRLVVFDDGIQGFIYRAPVETDVLTKASVVDTPPAKAASVRAPVIAYQSFDLPEIGPPPEAKPTLSAKLGLSGDAAKRFKLVTFAPTNVSDERIAGNTELLSSTGFPVASVNRVDFKVSRNHVRYYDRSDEKVARAIAAEIGGPARDFTSLRNAPPPGQVEIWLQGNRKIVRATNTTPRQSVTAAQRRAAAKAQLERRLVNSLRRGDHLKGISQ